jgi:dTMP kinase
LFVSIDGIDGAGKTSQLNRLEAFFQSQGREVVRVRDPGTTAPGEAIRNLLLNSNFQLHRRAEALLYMAARCQLVEERIRPALSEGAVVLSDRFLLANVCYQSVGGSVTADALWELGRIATAGLRPDLTILLDLPAAAAFQRIRRSTDRIESRGTEYMEAVRQCFLQQISHASDKYLIVNAAADEDTVWSQIELALSL